MRVVPRSRPLNCASATCHHAVDGSSGSKGGMGLISIAERGGLIDKGINMSLCRMEMHMQWMR